MGITLNLNSNFESEIEKLTEPVIEEIIDTAITCGQNKANSTSFSPRGGSNYVRTGDYAGSFEGGKRGEQYYFGNEIRYAIYLESGSPTTVGKNIVQDCIESAFKRVLG